VRQIFSALRFFYYQGTSAGKIRLTDIEPIADSHEIRDMKSLSTMDKGDETRLRNLQDKAASEELTALETRHLKRLELKKKNGLREKKAAAI
jgi:hypothetical protein